MPHIYESAQSPTRKTFLGLAVLLPAAAAMCSAARADNGKVSPQSMQYQTTPNGDKQCSGCKFFVPGQDASANGSCQIVDGAISPHGYCKAYSAKSS